MRMVCLMMSFQEELKRIRQKCLLSQEVFAKEIGVSFSTVNRWECGKTKPNLIAMKNIRSFCDNHNFDFNNLQDKWLDADKENSDVSK